MPLTFDSKKWNGIAHIKLFGEIDAVATLPVVDTSTCSEVQIDLREIRAITSEGCEAWSQWLNGFDRSTSVSLCHCSPTVIQFLNSRSDFLGYRAYVRSLLVPYYCAPCGSEELVLFSTEKPSDIEKTLRLPYEQLCPRCHRTMELDVAKSDYLIFLGKKSA